MRLINKFALHIELRFIQSNNIIDYNPTLRKFKNLPGHTIYPIGNVPERNGPLCANDAEIIVGNVVKCYPNVAKKIIKSNESMNNLAGDINAAFAAYRKFAPFVPKAKIFKFSELSANLSKLSDDLTTELERAPRVIVKRFNAELDDKKSVSEVVPSVALVAEIRRLSDLAKISVAELENLEKFNIDTTEAQYLAGRGLVTVYKSFFKRKAGITRAPQSQQYNILSGPASGPYPKFVLEVFDALGIRNPSGGPYSGETVAKALTVARAGARGRFD